nr:hypothetical protein [uncultured Flavobacterium sp.]
MILKQIYLLVFTFFFSLCLSENCVAQKLPEEQLRFHKDHTENGLIFGTVSFTNSKARFNGYFPMISYISEDKKARRKNSEQIHISPQQIFKMKHNGEMEDGKTYLFVLEKVPGKYTIPGVRLFTNGGMYSRNDLINGFSIPFEVKKGEILYIGEITINEYAKEGEPVITVSDKFDRDVRGLKNRQKLINWDSAVKSALTINYGTIEKEDGNQADKEKIEDKKENEKEEDK